MDEDQVDDIIQRWRDTPEEDLKPEDFQLFQDLGCSCLAGDDQAIKLLKFVQDDRNQGIVKSMGRVLVPTLVREVVQKGKGLDHCRAAITYLTTICRAEELLHTLLVLMEDVHPDNISDTVTVLVPHFQTVLLRDRRPASSVGRILRVLQQQASRLPVPYTQRQEADDEFGTCRCCSALTGFTKSLAEEVKKGRRRSEGEEEEEEELRTELLKFCLTILREPLLEAELNRDRKSSIWLFATEIMVTLPALQASVSDLLFFDSLRRNTQVDQSHFLESRACLAYLLFVQLVSMETFPAVFSPVFVLQRNMEYINQLLSSKKESHLLKGLALFSKSLESVQDNSLTVSLLELRSFYTAPQNLRQILTDCPIQHLRTSGLQLLQLFINKLETEAKHKFFRCMLKTSHHAGVEGFIIQNIKNQVEFSMEPGNDNTSWFLGEELISLMEMVLSLPQGPETDLLNTMDRIMESLNLLRYLLIRHKELRSRTHVWEELSRIKKQYLKILRVCLSISRSYYSTQLKALREERKLKAKEARDAAKSSRLVKNITVKNKNMSNMSPEDQHQVLQSALVTFDLMESLIARVEEIAEEKLK